MLFDIVIFHVSRRRREMYIGHARLCVCLSICLPVAALPYYCTDPGVTWGNGRGCLLVVHYWADLQSVHGFRWYGNLARRRNVSECLYSVYAMVVFNFMSKGRNVCCVLFCVRETYKPIPKWSVMRHAVSRLWHCRLGHLTRKILSPIWPILCLVGR